MKHMEMISGDALQMVQPCLDGLPSLHQNSVKSRKRKNSGKVVKLGG